MHFKVDCFVILQKELLELIKFLNTTAVYERILFNKKKKKSEKSELTLIFKHGNMNNYH